MTGYAVARALDERLHYFLPAAALAFFVFLTLAYLGLYPLIMADEQYYSLQSRLAPMSDAAAPNFVFYWIFGATNVCGAQFLACARIFNIAALMAAAPFVYLVAREVCSRPAAMLVSAIAVLGPYNSYAAYFMPEALFFLSFWIFAWCLFTMQHPASLARWALAGAAFGIVTLIKPHALFIAPVVAVCSLLAQLGRGSSWASALTRIVVLAAAAAAVKYGLSYAAVGRAGLTLFGPAYTGYTTGFDYQRTLAVFLRALESLRGHTMGLCFLFGLPILVAISNLLDRPKAPGPLQSRRRDISIFVLLAIATLLAIVTTYTGTVWREGPWNELVRIHMRYYNYLFPFFLMLAAERMKPADAGAFSIFRILVAVPVVLIIAYALVRNLDGFVPSFIDSPELGGIFRYRGIFLFTGILSLLAVVLWTWSSGAGARAFCLVVAPLCAAISWYVIFTHDLRWRIHPDVHDRAGLFARNSLSYADRTRIVVIGSDAPGLYRALFHIDTLNATVIHVVDKPGEPPPVPAPDRRWALTFKEIRFAADPPLIIRMDGFNLVQLPVSDKSP